MKPNKHLLALALAVLSQQLWAEDLTITLANGEWPPYLGEKLPHIGSVSRIVSEAFAGEGVKVVYKFYPWKRALETAREGEADGTLVWLKNDDRVANFHLSEPVISAKYVLLHPKSAPLSFNSVADLAGKKLGGTTGYEYGKEWADAEKAGKIKVDYTPTDEQNIAKIINGRLDGFPIDLEVGLYMASLHHGKEGLDKVGWAPKPLKEDPMYVLISKKSPKGPELVKRLNAGLAKLKASGKLEQYLIEGRSAKAK